MTPSDILYNIIGRGQDVAMNGGGGGVDCCAATVDGTGQKCNWGAPDALGNVTWSGTGPASGGYGCILKGGSGSATAG